MRPLRLATSVTHHLRVAAYIASLLAEDMRARITRNPLKFP